LNIQTIDLLKDSQFPWWEWRISTNVVVVSPQKVEMLGYDYADFADAGYQAYTNLLHPEDFERAMNAMRDVLSGRSDLYQADYRIRAADGSYHWYMDRGIILEKQPNEKPELIRGIVLDLGQHIMTKKPKDVLMCLLRSAIGNDVKSEVLTICANCHRIKSNGQWLEVSETLSEFIALPKSHTICPKCMVQLYPDLAKDVLRAVKADSAGQDDCFSS